MRALGLVGRALTYSCLSLYEVVRATVLDTAGARGALFPCVLPGRLEEWQRQIRRGLLVFIAFMGLGALLSRLFLPRFGEFFAGVSIGSGLGMAWWVWDDPPDWIAKWKRGATGEQMTEKQLSSIERNGWRTFHDREGKSGISIMSSLDQAVCFYSTLRTWPEGSPLKLMG